MHKVKITVIKKSFNRDLVNQHLTEEEKGKFGPCETFQVGQEFIVESWPAKPEGFCDWAWLDIQRVVGIAAFGGQVEGTVPENTWPVGCTDALRPVAFLVEPIGEERGGGNESQRVRGLRRIPVRGCQPQGLSGSRHRHRSGQGLDRDDLGGRAA